MTHHSKFIFTLSPGRYGLTVLVRNIAAQPAALLQITYPSPQLQSVDHHYIRAGDSLHIEGQYIKTDTYQYGLRLIKAGQGYTFPIVGLTDRGFSAQTDPRLVAGRYQVQIINQSAHTYSRDTSFWVQLYDPNRPFITKILMPKASYSTSDTMRAGTINFGTIPARFYQVQLMGEHRDYTINGIYEATRQQLVVLLPTSIASGQYRLGMRLLSTTGELLYSFETDHTVLLR